MRWATLVLAAAAGAALVLGLVWSPSTSWRMKVVELKATGRLREVSWLELFGRLSSSDVDHNGARWIDGIATLRHTSGEAPCPAVFDTPVGRLHSQLEDEFDVEWFVNKSIGLLEKQTQAGLMPVIEPGDVIIEAGAWVGAFTRTALRYGAAQVIALEPVPDNFECLQRGLAEEIAAGRVIVVEAAAWHSPGSVRMKQQGPNNFTGGTEGWNVSEEGDLEVRAVTVDGLVAELGLARVDLIEMDIEGSERHALAGASEMILQFKPQIAACIHHLPDDPQAVPAAVENVRTDYQVRRNNRHILYFD